MRAITVWRRAQYKIGRVDFPKQSANAQLKRDELARSGMAA
jgi:hypothetical protein